MTIVKLIVAQLVTYIEQYQKTGGYANGKAKNIYERVETVLEHVSHCYFKIIPNHDYRDLS